MFIISPVAFRGRGYSSKHDRGPAIKSPGTRCTLIFFTELKVNINLTFRNYDVNNMCVKNFCSNLLSLAELLIYLFILSETMFPT